MFQVVARYGDIIFAATCDSPYSPDMANDMATQVRRAIITANAQLLDAETIDGVV